MRPFNPDFRHNVIWASREDMHRQRNGAEPLLVTNSDQEAYEFEKANPGCVVELRLGNKANVDTMGD